MGIDAMKIWPFDYAAEASQGHYISASDLKKGLEPFEKIRAAVGDRMDIMCELHSMWNRPSAVKIARALEEKFDFVVIAGDIYDGEWKDNTIGLFFNREIAHLDRAGIPVFLLRGNHDAESVVTRSITLPDTVHEFGTRKPATFRLDALQVALHGQRRPLIHLRRCRRTYACTPRWSS